MSSTGIKKRASRVALVLSGGSARGIAHVGILSVLEEHHIPISFILAASYGSIVGAYYSYGYSPHELLRMMKEFKLKRVFEYWKPWKGILSAKKTLSLFEKDLPGAQLKSLNIPLSILATDIRSGEMVVIEEGKLSEAMLASSSFPGLYEPFRLNNRLLTDGGILNKMLVSTARRKGADLVIYCDVSMFTVLSKNRTARTVYRMLVRHAEKKRAKLEQEQKRITLRHIVLKSCCIVTDNHIVHEQFIKEPPDFLIYPSVEKFRPLHFGQVDALYRAGREATLSVVQEIRKKVC
jgi:NTE family protein